MKKDQGRVLEACDSVYSKFFLIVFVFTLGVLFSQSVLTAGRTDGEDSDPEVRSVTNKTRDIQLRIKSIEALLVNDRGKAVPLLIDILKGNDEEPFFRYLAAEKLAIADRSRAKLFFEDCLNDREADPFVRKAAVAQLAVIDRALLNKKIPAFLANSGEDPDIRQYVLALYAQAGGDKIVFKLREFVLNENEVLNMRMNALYQLESLGDLEFVGQNTLKFIRAKQAPLDLRKNAVLIAEKLEDPKTFSPMVDVAVDRSEPFILREMVLSSLVRRKAPESFVPRLESCLKSEPDQGIRQSLRTAIDSMSGKSTKEEPRREVAGN